MQITVKYKSQVKKETGIASETLDIAENNALQGVLSSLADKYGNNFRKLLFDDNGNFKNAILLAVNNMQVHYSENQLLNQNDILTIMSPIAGG